MITDFFLVKLCQFSPTPLKRSFSRFNADEKPPLTRELTNQTTPSFFQCTKVFAGSEDVFIDKLSKCLLFIPVSDFIFSKYVTV